MNNYKQRVLVSANHEKRFEICSNCENLTKFKVCKVCDCFMPLKTKLIRAKCPEHRWGEL